MILFDPIFHTLDHKLAHGFALAGRLVAAATAVAVGAVGVLAVEVVGTCALEVAAVDIPGVVIHHVEDDLDACLVQRLHHLLKLADARFGFVGIGRVAALGHVIVHGIIAPVVLWLIEAGLIDRRIVKRRQDVHCIHAQGLQVVDGARLGQGQEFALVLDAAGLIDGEVTMVHLVDDQVLGSDVRPLVSAPALRVGINHIDDGAAMAVNAHCCGPDSRALAHELATILHVKGVEHALQVTLDTGLPQRTARSIALHVDGLDGLAAQASLIDAQFHLLGALVGLNRKSASAGAVGDPIASVDNLWYD